jgi:hypothetical protein
MYGNKERRVSYIRKKIYKKKKEMWRQASKMKLFWWRKIYKKKKKIDHDVSSRDWRNPNYLMIKCSICNSLFQSIN